MENTVFPWTKLLALGLTVAVICGWQSKGENEQLELKEGDQLVFGYEIY